MSTQRPTRRATSILVGLTMLGSGVLVATAAPASAAPPAPPPVPTYQCTSPSGLSIPVPPGAVHVFEKLGWTCEKLT